VPRYDYGLIRVPPEILPALEARLKVERHLVVAWLQSVCATFPGRGLVNLLREKPKFFLHFCVNWKGRIPYSFALRTSPVEQSFTFLLYLLLEVQKSLCL
jgi:hypothetical protein